ncbi:MAG: hypothetical protein ACK47B_01440 [Armatimonadota bacterium]
MLALLRLAARRLPHAAALLVLVLALPFAGRASASQQLSGWLAVTSQCSAAGCRIHLSLVDGRGGSIELLPGAALASQHGLTSAAGQRVEVTGQLLPGVGRRRFRIATLRRVPGAAPRAAAAATGEKRYATLLVRYADEASVTPRPTEYFERLLGDEKPGAGHFYREISDGRLHVSGDVFGWYTLPRPSTDYATPELFDFDQIIQDAVAAADADVYFPAYDGILVVSNVSVTPGALTYALGTVGTRPVEVDGETRSYGLSWMEPTINTTTFHQSSTVHEIGHNLGLFHSSGPYEATYDSPWDYMSGGQIPSGGEYGLIGTGGISYHQDQLGWIPAERKLVVPAGVQQTVELERLNQPAANDAYLMAQIPLPGGSPRFYTVEARKKVGYDETLPSEGVVIHLVDPTRQGTDRLAQVVDGDGNGFAGDGGTVWVPGELFVDRANGLSVRVVGETATGCTVQITTGASALPPDDLRSTVAGATRVDLAWTRNPTEATGFVVERRTQDGPFSQIGTVEAGQSGYSDLEAPTERLCTYRIRALLPAGSTDPSNEVTAFPERLPTAPAALTATAGKNMVTLRWTDTSDNETAFEVEKAFYHGGFFTVRTVPANTEQVTVETLDWSLKIGEFYRVRAVTARNAGPYSDRVRAGASGKLVVKPSRLQFPTTRRGKRAVQKVLLRNAGAGPLTVSFQAPEGPFTLAPGSHVLAPQGKLQLTVTFAPTVRGKHRARLVVQSDDAKRPMVNIPMSGTAR